MNEHIQRLLAVIDAYKIGDPIKDTTLSFRVFGDSKTKAWRVISVAPSTTTRKRRHDPAPD